MIMYVSVRVHHQVILYSMMLRDRYQIPEHPGGLLAYLRTKHVQGIPAFTHERNGETVGCFALLPTEYPTNRGHLPILTSQL